MGGIVGQAEPYVEVEVSESKLSDLERRFTGLENEVDTLFVSMDELYESVGNSKDAVSPYFSKLQDTAEELKDLLSKENEQLSEDSQILENVLKKVDVKLGNIEIDLAGVEDALEGLNTILKKMEQDTSVEATEVRKRMNHISEILENLTVLMEDMSELDILEDLEAPDDSSDSDNTDDSDTPIVPDDLPGLDDLPNLDDLPGVDDLPNLDNTPDWDELLNLDTIFNQEALEELKESLEEMLELMAELMEESEKMLESLQEYMDSIDASLQQIPGYRDKLESHIKKISGYTKDIKGYLEELDVFGTMNNMQDFQKDITTLTEDLLASMDHIQAELELMDGNVSDLAEEINGSVKDIKKQADLITDAGEEILDEPAEEIIMQIGKEDIAAAIYGKIEKSVNYASVEGDFNVGGIVGIMSIEYEADPEEELSENLSWREQKTYELKTVLFDCTNKGQVTANKNTAGGICGQTDVGIISTCYGYGSVTSVTGDYVGGIAGIARSTITDCIAKNDLSGKRYVGGIVGSGSESAESSSIIENNYAMVKISDCQQFEGAIAGCDLGDFKRNYFVSDTLSGINRISYDGKAEKITYAKLLEKKNLPEELKTFTLYFMADDKVVKALEFSYGDSFSKDIFPKVPSKDGYNGVWDTKELKNLCFDTVVTAEYTPYVTALRTEAERKNGRPVFILEGEFDEDDKMTATQQTVDETLKTEYQGYGDILESWKIAFDDDGKKRHSIRFLAEQGKENVNIYVKEKDDWVKAETEEFGSYDTFQISGNEAELMIIEKNANWLTALVYFAGIVFLLVLIFYIHKKTHFAAKLWKKTVQILKKKSILLVCFLCIAAGTIGMTVYLARVPEVRMAAELAALSSDILADKNQSMEVDLIADIGKNHIELDSDVSLVTYQGEQILVLDENEHAVYFCGENLFLENGKGFHLGEVKENRFSLLEQVIELFKMTEITKSEEQDKIIYSVSTEGEDSVHLLEMFLTSAEGQISSDGKVQIDLVCVDGNLETINIYGEGSLKDAMETSIKVSAVISDISELQNGEDRIPESVKEAVKNAEKTSYQSIGEEMYRLLLAWVEFSSEEQTGTVALDISCGHLVLETEHEWTNIMKGLSQIENRTNLQKIPDVVYEICMNGDFTCETIDRKYFFYMKLDQDAMQKLSEMMLPQIVNQSVDLTDGGIKVIVDNNKVAGFEIEIRGKVTVLLAQMDASLGAEFVFE